MREYLIRGRPAIFAGGAFAIGITCGKYVVPFLVGGGIVVLFVLALAVLCTKKFAVTRIAILAAALILLGAELFCLDRASYSDTMFAQLARFKISNACLTGTIVNSSETQTAYVWVLATDSIGIGSQPPLAMHGMVLVRLSKVDTAKFGLNSSLPQQGTHLKIFSTLEPFRAPTNPHEYASDLKIQTDTHTEAQAYIHSRYDYYIVGNSDHNVFASIDDWIASVHLSITTLLDRAIVDLNTRGFVKAVVLGERNDMEKETLNDFTTAGVAHILAVSGFNVAIISLVTAQLLRLLGIYWQRPRTIVTMLVVLLYSVLVGFQPSVVRALIMIECYFLAQLLERKTDSTNILFGAAALNVLFRPSDLFDVGFQLSYLAVFGLLQISPVLKRLFMSSVEKNASIQHSPILRNIIVKSVDAAALSLGASIASYPVIATHFYRISFIGLVANLPIIPLSGIITALGFLLIPLTAISQWLGQLYGEGITFLTKGLLLLIKWCAHIPIASHSAASPSWGYLVFLLCAIVYCLRAVKLGMFVGRLAVSIVGYLILSALYVPFTDSILAENNDKLQVLFFDVGQGDCIFVHTPSNKSYFIDFGTIDARQNSPAERVVLPFLRAENTTAIAAGFITHMHRDHFGGALTIVQNCSTASMYTSGERVSEPLARELDRTAREQHMGLQVLARGDTLQLDSNLTLYVLHPDSHVPRALSTQYGQNIHSGMLAFKLVYRNTSFLFLGDVEQSEEEEIKATYGNFLHSNVVKVAHHGSLTSSSKEFVAAVNPKIAVISVGQGNHFGHPSPAVVRRWMASGAAVCRTDLDGAILLVSDGKTVNRVNWK